MRLISLIEKRTSVVGIYRLLQLFSVVPACTIP